MRDKLIKQLLKIVLECKSEEELKDLFVGLLTPGEFEEIATRVEIIKRLKQGTPQREIAEKLQVGIATVSRGTREIRMGHFKKVK